MDQLHVSRGFFRRIAETQARARLLAASFFSSRESHSEKGARFGRPHMAAKDRRAVRAQTHRMFFVPGLEFESGRCEHVYEGLRQAAAQATGDQPYERRIFRLACRLGGRRHLIEVGRPDPIRGHVVRAIFDVGGLQPYVVYTTRSDFEPAFRLGKYIDSVTEFLPGAGRERGQVIVV